MAKKQQAAESAEKTAPDAAAPAPPAGEAKAKAPKAPREKKPKADAAPAAAPEASPAAAPVAADAAAPAAPASAAATDEAPARKRKPGVPPARGKRLRNQLKSQRQKIGKEPMASLKKAVGVLKGLRRAKFDETVEVHMSLGVDTTQSDQLVRGTVP